MRGASTGDSYVRLASTVARTITYGTPNKPDALLFVDLACEPADAEGCLRRIRDLPYGHFLGVSRLVVRMPFGAPNSGALVESLLGGMATMLPQIAPAILTSNVLVQPFGEPAQLWDTQGQVPEDTASPVIRRARAVELSAFLEANHAVWAPAEYHFRLPNGLHASSFVRLADGLSSPRDIEAVASWLLPDLKDRRGLVFDNRSLNPVAIGLQRLYEKARATCGPITFLEHYLETQFDIEAAVRESASGGGGVLGVLSVSSAGNTKDRMLAAFDRAAQPSWRLHILLDRNVDGDAPLLGAETDEVSTWLGFNHGQESAAPAEQCAACLQKATRRLVAIDPRFFDGMILPNPTLTMLQPASAQEAAPFWEACDSAGAVALEHRPSAETKSRRSTADDKSGRMAVYVSMQRLLADPEFQPVVRQATQSLLIRRARNGERVDPSDALGSIDAVIVSSAEYRSGPSGDHFREVLRTILEELPGDLDLSQVQAVDHEVDPSSWGKVEREAVQASERLLIVGAGTVSGYTMQRLLVGCQEQLRGARNPQRLTGLLIHARPATLREWTTLRNSFGSQLFALFATLLPTTSPLKREAETVAAMRRDVGASGGEWESQLDRFLAERSAVCQGSGVEISSTEPAPYVPLLWGLPLQMSERSRIRQHSLFGHKLGPAAYMSAVGSAVHRERERIAEIRGPVWHLFEMPALLRSYYDPLLIAAMLRWMEASEIWWGDQALGAVTALLSRGTEEDEAVLLPELLLAAAHGKIPEDAAEAVEGRAAQLIASPPGSFAAREVVALGAGLLAWRSERAGRHRRPESFEPLPPWPTSISRG